MKRQQVPDFHSNQVFTMGLLNHVADGVAAHKGYVDVVSCNNIQNVVAYGVNEHDVCII